MLLQPEYLYDDNADDNADDYHDDDDDDDDDDDCHTVVSCLT